MSIKPDVLKKLIDALKNDLGEGFVSTNIWATEKPKPLVRDNKSSAQSLTIFNEVTEKLNKALQGSDLPGMGNYYMISLPGSRLAVTLLINSYHHSILLDLSKTTMGILISVALPNLISGWEEASKQKPREHDKSNLENLFDALSIGLQTLGPPKGR